MSRARLGLVGLGARLGVGAAGGCGAAEGCGCGARPHPRAAGHRAGTGLRGVGCDSWAAARLGCELDCGLGLGWAQLGL